MKLAVSNIAWDIESDKTIFTKMVEFGFNYLEIAPTRLCETKVPYSIKGVLQAKEALKDIRDKYGIEVCSMQSILFGVTERLFKSTEERLKLLDYLDEAFCYASKIGCTNLVFGSPKNRVIDDAETQYQIGIDFFIKAAEIACKNGVILSIEPNPTIYNTNYINTTQQAVKLIKEVNHPAFRLNLDVGTVIYNKENIEDLEEAIKLSNHIHISEPNLVPIKKRREHVELYAVLKALNYKNVISIEMKKQNNIQIFIDIMEYIYNLMY